MLPIVRGRALESGLPTSQSIDSLFIPPVAENEEISLLSIFRMIRRHRWLLVGTVMFGIIAAILFILLSTPLYNATAYVAVGVGESDSLSRDAILETELQYLQAPYFLEKAIDTLRLNADPEFNEALDTDQNYFTQLLNNSKDLIKGALINLGVLTPPTPERQALIDQDNLLETVQDRFSVSRPGESNVISLSFLSSEPLKAARIADALSGMFVNARMTRILEVPNQDLPKLQDAATAARKQLEDSNQKLEDFRRRAGILRGGQASSTAAAEQLAGLTRELIAAGAARAEAEATLAQVKGLSRANLTDSALAVLGSPLIQNLREREAELLREKADLATTLGAKHPRLQGIDAALGDLQAKISQETARLIAAQEHQVVIARARERSIQQDVDQMSRKVAEQSDAEARLASLDRQVDADQRALDNALSSVNDATKILAVTSPATAAVVLAKAQPESKPDYPKAPLVLLIGIIGGLAVGGAIALLREGTRRGFRSGSEIERHLGVAAFLAPVPKVSYSLFSKRTPDDDILSNEGTMLREALRTLYVNMLLSADNKMPRSILVTSCEPKEGKTTIALGLARVMAMSGSKTLLVEADLRLPRLQRSLGLKQRQGLIQVLSGEAQFKDCIVADPKQTGLQVLVAGGKASNPVEMLGRKQMLEMMDAARQEFDCVIVDSPPTMAVGDSRLLVPLADATLLVAKWDSTDRNTVAYAASELSRGGKMPWIVLSMVAPETYGELGFGDSAYTSKAVMQYLSTSGGVAR